MSFPEKPVDVLEATSTLYYPPPLAGQTAQGVLQTISASSPIICGFCWCRLRQALHGTAIIFRLLIVEAAKLSAYSIEMTNHGQAHTGSVWEVTYSYLLDIAKT